MIKIENVVTSDARWIEAVARGMRNSFNSWHLNDTDGIIFGPNDMDLAKRLVRMGTSDAKFMRMIPIIFDVTGPMYWWKEFDTYKIATVRNSCSTMHKIMAKEFTMDDFSIDPETSGTIDSNGELMVGINNIIYTLNELRKLYLEEKDPTIKRSYWDAVIQMLPESYNQRSTVTMNYAVLANIYHQRKNHKLGEWHTFCDWIDTLPMSELITGKEKE